MREYALEKARNFATFFRRTSILAKNGKPYFCEFESDCFVRIISQPESNHGADDLCCRDEAKYWVVAKVIAEADIEVRNAYYCYS